MNGEICSLCPTMDLLAVSTPSGISMCRMNGELVYAIDVPNVKHLEWKPNGKQLCLVTDQVLIYDSNTGKLMNTLRGNIGITRWITLATEAKKKYEITMNITESLPKLPPVPGKPKHSITQFSNELDLLMMFAENSVDITMHGLFSLGIMQLYDSDDEIVNCESLDESHYILTSSYMTMAYKLRAFRTTLIKHYDLFIQITTASSKIIALLKYIEDVLSYLGSIIKSYLDDNTRFLNILKNELAEENETMGEELYNLLLTGMMREQLKDWIQNSLGDRNLKKWSTNGDSTYNSIRRTITYHLIPSCERLIILLSQLDSLSRSTMVNEFEIGFISESLESVKKLLILLYESIFKLNEEHETFKDFVLWLQHTFIEIQDDRSSLKFSVSKVSKYINDHLERPMIMTLIPFTRRSYNEIKINTQDMFTSIKDKIRMNVYRDPFEVELGRVGDRQLMKIRDHSLYIFSQYDKTLEIYRVHLRNRSMESTKVILNEVIRDIGISEKLYVVSDKVYQLDYLGLFGKEEHRQDTLPMVEEHTDLQVGHIAMSARRETGYAVDVDLQKYVAFPIQS
jgi:hypothetical protein